MESLELVMKRDARILAEYLGGAISFHAYHMTNPQLDGFAYHLAFREALLMLVSP